MKRADCIEALYPELKDRLVVTIMGACAQELYDLGHRENFFYLQYAMGLASSIGLGLAMNLPHERVVVLDGDGSMLMNLGGLATLARYRPANLTHIIFDNGSLLSTGGFASHTTAGLTDLAVIAQGAGCPQVTPVNNLYQFKEIIMSDAPNVLALLVEALAEESLKVVDLTQLLSPATPVIELPPEFAQSPPLTIETISRYNEAGPAWYWNTLHLGEHTGTHFDAPAHWITGKALRNNTVDTLPVGNLIGPACVIDVSQEVVHNEDFLLTREHVRAWEETHGQIPAGAWLLLRTDWSKRQGREEFLNIKEDGPHSPGFQPDCIKFLAEERELVGVGVETVGTDAGQAGGFEPPFPAHNFLHGAGKFGLASLCHLDLLPPVGAVLIAAPLKIIEGSGSPLRVLALVPALTGDR